jgi:altronate hydrolase
MLRTLSNYADHPNVGGVILMDLGCEKTNLAKVEQYLLKREQSFDKPVAKIGIQDVGGTEAAIALGLKEVESMLPKVNETAREECSISELVLGVKCGSSDGFSGISANPSLGRAADLLVRSGGTVLITEVPNSAALNTCWRNARKTPTRPAKSINWLTGTRNMLRNSELSSIRIPVPEMLRVVC